MEDSRRNLMEEYKGQLAIVCTFYNVSGGISSYVKGLETALKRKNQRLAVISPDVDSDLNISHLKAAGRMRLSVFFSALILLVKVKPQSIQCHGAWYLLVSCLVYKWVSKVFLRKIQIVAIKHTEIIFPPRTIKKNLLCWFDSGCDYIVFVSNRHREAYLEANNEISEEKTRVVWPGVDRQFIEHVASIEKYNRLDGGDSVITYMGVMEFPEKVQGLFVLIEAIALMVSRDNAKVKLVIAGDGRLSDEVDEKINELNVQENVVRLGMISDRAEFFFGSDLHCHISLKDNFPVVILEALACGVNVLANDCGDLESMGLKGLHICEPDVERVAEDINKLLKNQVKVDSDYILSMMSWDVCASKFLDISGETK